MIDAPMIDQERVLLCARLEKLIRDLGDMALTASNCVVNFEWLSLKPGGRLLPLLDFDVIYGSMGDLLVTDVVSQLAEETENPSTEIGTDRIPATLLGPNSIRNLLTHLRYYSLPPGAVAELIEKKSRLTGRVSERADRFISKLSNARSAIDPAPALIESFNGEDALDAVRRELSDLATDVEDVQLLDALLAGSQPIDELTDQDKPIAADAFNIAHSTLAHFRPKFGHSNLHDAMNFAVATNLFRSPQPSLMVRPIPIMISLSEAVGKLRNIQAEVLLPDAKEFRLLDDHRYLLMTFTLLNEYEERYDLLAEAARQLHDDISRLAESYKELYKQLKSKPSDNCEAEWTMISARMRYMEPWFRIFRPALQAGQHDRATFINRLLNARTAKWLTSKSSDRRRAALGELIGRLRKLRRTDEATAICIDYVASHNAGTQSSVFRLSLPSEKTALLLQTKPGRSLEGGAAIVGVGHTRIATHILNIEYAGAVMVFDLLPPEYDDPSEVFITVSWPHVADAQIACRAAGGFLKGMASYDGIAAECQYALYSPSHKDEGVIDVAAIDELAQLALNKLNGWDYFKFTLMNLSVAADIRPIDSVEMQFSVCCSLRKLREVQMRAIADLAHSTLAYKFQQDALVGVIRAAANWARGNYSVQPAIGTKECEYADV